MSWSDPVAAEREVRAVLGEWRSSIVELQRQVATAERNSELPLTYQQIKHSVYQLDAPYFAVARATDQKTGIDFQKKVPTLGVFKTGYKDVIHTTETVWELAAKGLGEILLKRKVGLVQRLKLYLGTAALVSLTGIGSAFYLFRSSFRRLDDLEVAKVEAETAQEESEAMNRRLTQINNEIVHLNQELADKMRRLKDVQDELLKRGRLEQLGQLTATVAHELRNPLGAVRTSAFLLERKVKDKGLGVEAQLQRINNGISRCDSIITQLLDFSRTKQISAQPTNLDEWLVGIVEEEAKRLPAAVEIECSLGLGGIEIPFDPARLQRAVINLISNASEAMVGTGEDTSKFSVKLPKLSIVTAIDANMVAIMVSDNGPGISSDILDKIREPLFTTKSFGTGLGIPAVEQIATQHGGRLEIASEVGSGARFTILLPLVSPESVAA
jgi:signal transduction histidine kinase